MQVVNINGVGFVKVNIFMVIMIQEDAKGNNSQKLIISKISKKTELFWTA